MKVDPKPLLVPNKDKVLKEADLAETPEHIVSIGPMNAPPRGPRSRANMNNSYS